MNTVNLSTGLSPFQPHMGRSPQLILPLMSTVITDMLSGAPEAETAVTLIEQLALNVKEAQDNLFAVKVYRVASQIFK
jgi:hypothetical protein